MQAGSKRTLEESEESSGARRGARASYYRKAAKTDDDEAAAGSEEGAPLAPPPLPTDSVRTPHEALVDACEEGDLARVKQCLARSDVDNYLNQVAIARNIVMVRCPKTGATLDWGHPELLACGRGDTPLRYAAFHGYAPIVKLLLDAGSVPWLRNDECKSALHLAKEAGKLLSRYVEQQKKEEQLKTLALAAEGEGTKTQPKKSRKDSILAADLPRGDPNERVGVIQMLQEATDQQWIIVNYERPELNGRIAQITSVRIDGRRCAIIDDAEASAERPFYLQSAVRSASLRTDQLRKLPAPKPPQKTWPLGARFCCMLAGESACACAFGPTVCLGPPLTTCEKPSSSS
mmetsp:Transcript_28622/g.73419  ORF Transcript_28622/g.73419 Transcript_28622/m.73419 type:complete len:347 (+) Transcript_28622:69-1109(+)